MIIVLSKTTTFSVRLERFLQILFSRTRLAFRINNSLSLEARAMHTEEEEEGFEVKLQWSCLFLYK